MHLSDLDGTNGFRIDGESKYDRSGYSVSAAGDVNGDGFADLIVGAPSADPAFAGASYVVFGGNVGFPAELDLAALDGSNGFRITGGEQTFGGAVSGAGDVNGDGFDDLIVGAQAASPNGRYSGSSFVVFGAASFASQLDVVGLDGNDGFRINGIAAYDESGHAVSSAGDINGDGFDDLLIGGAGFEQYGSASVVFGTAAGFPPVIELADLDGSNGFRMVAGSFGDRLGSSVSNAGDINGDGFDDIIVGAPNADSSGYNAGSSYVVFGSATPFPASLDLSTLDGSNGFRIDGASYSDASAWSVSDAGDVNGDGFDDVIIGAPFQAIGGSHPGSSYVVFGGAVPPAVVHLSDLDGSNGFRIDGEAAAGFSVSGAGDFNGDGFADVIIGAPFAGPNFQYMGATYVVFGSDAGFPAVFDVSNLDKVNGFRLDGLMSNDRSGWSVGGAGDINGDGFDDIIIGAPQADPNGYASGSSYVIFGRASLVTFIDGTPGDDSLVGTPDDDQISGFGGADTLMGLAGEDTLFGDDGNDVLQGGDAIDVLNGGAGDDVLDGGFGDDTLSGGADNDTLVGSFDNDALDGGSGNDSLSGGFGNDILTGAAGSDTLSGGFGFDVLNGGADSDTASYADSSTSVQVNLQNSSQQTVSFGFEGPAVHTLISIENLIGSNFNDQLTGSTADNMINGGGGLDIITGAAGNDTLIGGAGNDLQLDGGTGNDLIDGGPGTDTATYNGATSAVNVSLAIVGPQAVGGGLGTDTLIAVENLGGTGFNDTLIGDSNTNSLSGAGGNDSLIGADGDDSLTGSTGNDTLNGGAGSDTAIFTASSAVAVDLRILGPQTVGGGLGSDTLISIENLTGSSSNDTLIGDSNDNRLNGVAGSDSLIGGIGNDTLLGGAGNDTLDAGAGNDSLAGGAGDDTLFGGVGNDTLDGGTETDTANYAAATSGLTIDLNLTVAQAVGGGQGSDAFLNVENLLGSAFADALTGSAANNLLVGGAGNDTLNGGGGDDVLNGGAGNNKFNGGDGVDTVDYSAETVAVKANLQSGSGKATGNDTYSSIENLIGGSAGDKLTGDQAANLLIGNAGDDQLMGLQGADSLIGGDGADTLLGNGGDDYLTAGTGDDSIVGGDGSDTAYYGDSISDLVISLAIVTGQAIAGAGTDILLEIENLIGGSGFDQLTGNDSNNMLDGSAGDDQLFGGAGNDTLYGADGFDSLAGGSGTDSSVLRGTEFIFDPVFIVDYNFGEGDTIDLSNVLDGSIFDPARINHFARLENVGGHNVLQVDFDGTEILSTSFFTVGSFGGDVSAAHVSFNGQIVDIFAPPPGAVIKLADLDGSNGFRMDGLAEGDSLGFSVSDAGDVNGDGLEDFIVGAFGARTAGDYRYSGSSYLVFGTNAPFEPTFDLAGLDGSNGFRIDGPTAGIRSCYSVSAAGDMNGDGFDDVLIGAPSAYYNGSASGSTYVVFGRAGAFSATLDLSTLDGSNGFRIDGARPIEESGHSVSDAGDVNGDGISDIIIGAPIGILYQFEGSAYVVFGSHTPFGPSLSLSSLDGSNGFRIDGLEIYDRLGISVSGAGDLNGDGFDDVVVGARSVDPAMQEPGVSYVVFGSGAAFPATISVADLDGSNGFRIEGARPDDFAGYSVSSAGDVNGDGFGDIIVGAFGAQGNGYSGGSYVVFGSAAGFPATLQLSSVNGSNGFHIDGEESFDTNGVAVSSAGDFNGDGFDDVLVLSPGADHGDIYNSGSAYVVFGHSGPFVASFDLTTIDGSNGIRIDGTDSYQFFTIRLGAGHPVSAAGDINGDGFDDIVLGAEYGAPNGRASGQSFVIFGHSTALSPLAASAPASASAFDFSTIAPNLPHAPDDLALAIASDSAPSIPDTPLDAHGGGGPPGHDIATAAFGAHHWFDVTH